MQLMDNSSRFKIGKFKMIGLFLGLVFLVNQLAAQDIQVNKRKQIVIETKKGKYQSTKVSFGGLKSFKIEYRGDLEINDTDTDIIGLSRGGFLEINKTTFGSKRSIVIEEKEGRIVKEYYEGRRQVDFEPDGADWLAEILPDIIRSTGIAAESRIDRFYKKGGIDAVMNEIERLEGSYVQNIYGSILLNKEGLSNQELSTTIVKLAREMDSDYYKSELLSDVNERFLSDNSLSIAFFDAARYIDSDYYSAEILTDAIEDIRFDEEIFSKIMLASANIGSDYYQAEVLEEALEIPNLSDQALSTVIANTEGVGSDYYQAQVLSKAMQKRALSKKSFSEVVNAIMNIDSDYYMAEVLEKMLENRVEDGVLQTLITAIDRSMTSDYYKSSVLSDMVKSQTMTGESMSKLAEAIGNMSSDSYAAEVVEDAADIRDMPKAVLISLLEACGSINSDYYCTECLESLAYQVREGDEDVKDAYRRAAKSIGSSHYYGEALKAID